MSRFYASIGGNRGEAIQQGTPKSGIHGHIHGWDLGVKIRGYAVDDGEDQFDVYVTSGSNGRMNSRLLATITTADLEVKR